MFGSKLNTWGTYLPAPTNYSISLQGRTIQQITILYNSAFKQRYCPKIWMFTPISLKAYSHKYTQLMGTFKKSLLRVSYNGRFVQFCELIIVFVCFFISQFFNKFIWNTCHPQCIWWPARIFSGVAYNFESERKMNLRRDVGTTRGLEKSWLLSDKTLIEIPTHTPFI